MLFAYIGSIIRNNIWSNGVHAGGWSGGQTTPLTLAIISNNILASDQLFVDSANANMALRNYPLKKSATAAINQGMNVPPYDDHLVDQADIGPYEYGVPAWAVGAGHMPAAKQSEK